VQDRALQECNLSSSASMDCVKHPAGPGMIPWAGFVGCCLQAMVGREKLMVGKGDIIFCLWVNFFPRILTDGADGSSDRSFG
jgi:hypothetical protein